MAAHLQAGCLIVPNPFCAKEIGSKFDDQKSTFQLSVSFTLYHFCKIKVLMHLQISVSFLFHSENKFSLILKENSVSYVVNDILYGNESTELPVVSCFGRFTALRCVA